MLAAAALVGAPPSHAANVGTLVKVVLHKQFKPTGYADMPDLDGHPCSRHGVREALRHPSSRESSVLLIQRLGDGADPHVAYARPTAGRCGDRRSNHGPLGNPTAAGYAVGGGHNGVQLWWCIDTGRRLHLTALPTVSARCRGAFVIVPAGSRGLARYPARSRCTLRLPRIARCVHAIRWPRSARTGCLRRRMGAR